MTNTIMFIDIDFNEYFLLEKLNYIIYDIDEKLIKNMIMIII